MGQAYRGALEQALREFGAIQLRGRFTDGSTKWSVLAIFPRGTRQRQIVQLLWARFPGASVGGREIAHPYSERPPTDA
jgi:hypothetical protein